MGYRERALPGGGAVTCVWSRDVEETAELRIVPDGCVDLMFDGTRLWVAGPDTHAHVALSPPSSSVGARVHPGATARALGVAADEIRDGRVDLADIWPAARVRQVTEQLGDASGTRARQVVLARALTTKVEQDPVERAVLGGGPVPEIADQLGLSVRQLHRRCTVAFGYGPSTVHKVMRFQRALGLARKGLRLADVAAVTGFSDQAHLARDVRALAGVPMGQLL
jgi:AraC-like DNA-binding protein